jgi:methylenetetrahydrofolate dehydrogenase (NADP+)/methenyltetrahydrofolate cyclohydrolase
MVLILDGKALAAELAVELKNEVTNSGANPKLAVVMVGDNTSSEIYVRNKMNYAKKINIATELIRLSRSTSREKIADTVNRLNADDSVHGIIIQAPLPDQSYQDAVFDMVRADKDVDGFSASNIGKLCNGRRDCFLSCTPYGILTLLTRNNIQLCGRHVVIIGRSRIVGRPLSILLSQKFENCNATVTLCHSASKDLTDIARTADVLVAAVGKPKLISRSMVKEGAVVVDVGINGVNSGGKTILCGDVDFDDVRDRCSAITPVPGGVGPMTVAMLMRNTFQAYTNSRKA